MENFKINKSKLKLVAICVAGLALNISGTIVAHTFELDIYLDMIGTIFISALGGYVPGVTIGFLTNLSGMLFISSEFYFGLVSILTALLTAYLASKGYYEKFSKVIMTIPATVLLTSFLGALIEELLSISNSFNSLKSIEKIIYHAMDNVSYEFPDKTIAILLTFFLLKLISPDVKEAFYKLGKMQAPVSDKIREAINSKNNFISSLRTKMIVSMMSVTLIVAVLIAAISYTIYRKYAIDDRQRIADGIITMAVNAIDPKRVDEYLALGYQAKGYSEVVKKLHAIRASNSDIKYIYVYKILEDGCHVVFDLDTAEVKGSEIGSVEEFDDFFEEYVPDLLAGRPIPPIIGTDEYGYLLTFYKPVYNSIGKCVCYVGIDFSMDLINDYGRMFIAEVIAMFGGAVIFIFVLSLFFIENNIILPVNTMAYCARNFAYDSEKAREHNIEHMRSLDIKTHDEIENLYAAFLKTTEDSMHYFENLKRSKIQLAVMDQLAHTDSLTGLKNKTAYNEQISLLDVEILEGTAAFSIIMIDVNFLKKVNDTYGHERGNEYLINAAKLACKIFSEENVYRIGGDEFVVILAGENFNRTEEYVANIRAAIEKFRADKTLQPWEKVSAAVGEAYYTAGVDTSADEVFKRADAQMYQNKLAMKAVRKD